MAMQTQTPAIEPAVGPNSAIVKRPRPVAGLIAGMLAGLMAGLIGGTLGNAIEAMQPPSWDQAVLGIVHFGPAGLIGGALVGVLGGSLIGLVLGRPARSS